MVILPASGSAVAAGTAGGRWTKHEFRSEPVYSPPSVEVAKRFLRTVGGVHRRITSQSTKSSSVSDTPLTSRQGVSSRMSRLAQCHGCHGWLGGGLHVGSAIGKNVCNFQHSSLCRGGILENDSWKACPLDFVPAVDDYVQVQPLGTGAMSNPTQPQLDSLGQDQSDENFETTEHD